MKNNEINWKDYEGEVFQECERVFQIRGAEVKRNTHIVGHFSGVKRQIDIEIRQSNEEGVVNICIVECKFYTQKINVKIIDSFIGCMEDVGADKGILVSENGFTKAAINRAHKGKNNIEVDILSLGELQQFQAQEAIPYMGDCALVLSSPFGWIIDGTRKGFAPAVLYRRGLSFGEATGKEKEWMYIQFWTKQSAIDTVENLIETQNEYLRNMDGGAEIHISELDGLMIRRAFLPLYPSPEVTVFREFDWFIAFVVLYCPDCYIDRDTKKAVTMLKEAIPMHVKLGESYISVE